MTTTEKIVALRDLAGMNQNRFSKLIGVAPSTMTRLERGSPNKPSPDTLQKIADVFSEVTVEWLEDEANEVLPATLTLAGGRSVEALATGEKEGQRLRRFVERNKPAINQTTLGEALGVSRNQVASYYNTGRFREPVLIKLLSALSKVLSRPVSAQDVLGTGRGANPTTPTNLVAIPRLSVADRPRLTAKFLTELQNDFMPGVRPETAMYAPKQAVTVENIKRAYAIEVGPGDRMEPLYFSGYWVLGVSLEPAEYARLYDGTVAVLTNDGEFLLKKVLANNLRTTGVLELGSYTTERGGSVQLRKSDIQLMFSISGIIFGMAA